MTHHKREKKIFEDLYLEPSRNGLSRPSRIRGKGFKMVNMKEIFAFDRIKNPPMEFVPMDKNEIEKYSLKKGDLLFARQSLVASGAGKCSVVLSAPEITTFESHLIRVRIDTKKANPFFYFYYFRSPIGIAKTQSLVMQVAAAGIRASELAKLEIDYPPIIEQNKIVALLEKYDDLIENNSHRVKLLESMAKLVYDEWFVKFKFLGHEKVKMIYNKELDQKIPEGWKVNALKEAIKNVVLGGTPSRSKPEYWGGNIPWIKSGQLNDFRVIEGTEGITEEGLANSAAKMMPKRTVLIAITGAILISLSEIELSANQSVIGIYGSEKLCQEYIYLYEKSNINQFISKMSGSAQQHVNKEIVESSIILVPSDNILKNFSLIVKPIFDEISALMFKNKNLSRTRNLLLPKLISGELDVSGLDIKVPEVAA